MASPIVHHPAYTARDVPPDHRFPMRKFARLAEVLVEDGVAAPGSYFTPEPADAALLALAHDASYVDQVLAADVDPKRARRIGFAMTPAVALRAQCAVAGTLLAARLALDHGVACNTAGGSHHADYAGGAGFCVFNDVAVAARALLDERVIGSVLVIDLDVHQGDGTARIFETDPRVVTYSLHCEKNFPRDKARSDVDVGLPPGVDDTGYLDQIARDVPALLHRARPDLVFYVAGVDPHVDDRLGLFALTDEGLARRDRFVIDACHHAGVPVAGVLGGGYSRDIDALARRHALLHRAAAHAFAAQ